MSELLSMTGISKSFGANLVLDQVDFRVDKGQIHGLVGENGAGKSTLMNILGGVVQRDSGIILIEGQPVHFRTPAESLQAGIAFIHQELNLANDLFVYENLFLGRELKTKAGLTDINAMCAASQQLFDQMGVQLDPRRMTRDIDTSYKQIVEIARALLMQARLIIMDEPTTSLTHVEIDLVFNLMRTLAKQGVGFIFISHKLKEVLSICDRYSVLRDGRMVEHGQTAGAEVAGLARAMVGHEVRSDRLQTDSAIGAEVLSTRGLSRQGSYQDIDIQVRAGEVVGFTGLLGDGRSALFRSIFGVLPPDSGTILYKGQPVTIDSPERARKLRIGYVPSNRKENGIIKDLSILENGTLVTLPDYVQNGLIDQARQTADFDRQRGALSIKMGKPQDSILSLSGGNQQKVVLAKWLSVNPDLLIFDNPTQGVDVGAKEEIYDIIVALARRGVAIVLLTSEMPEIMRLCHRVYVMYHGRVAGMLHADETDEHRIMMLQTGGTD